PDASDHRRSVDRLGAGQNMKLRHRASSKLLLAGSGGRRATIRTFYTNALYERACKDRQGSGLPITFALDLPRPVLLNRLRQVRRNFCSQKLQVVGGRGPLKLSRA